MVIPLFYRPLIVITLLTGPKYSPFQADSTWPSFLIHTSVLAYNRHFVSGRKDDSSPPTSSRPSTDRITTTFAFPAQCVHSDPLVGIQSKTCYRAAHCICENLAIKGNFPDILWILAQA